MTKLNGKYKGSRLKGRGCLCEDGNRYSVECCEEDSIYNEGIGRTRKAKKEDLES